MGILVYFRGAVVVQKQNKENNKKIQKYSLSSLTVFGTSSVFSRVVTRTCSRPCVRCILGQYNLLYNIYKGYVRGEEVSLRAASKLISETTLETPRKYDLILKTYFFVKNVNWRLVCVFLPVLVPETACILH